MTLYHGSEFVIKVPVFGLGKRHNDYGQGFYCTENKVLAGEWSVSPLHDGYINAYNVDLSGMNVLNLAGDGFSVLNWLAILLENRIFDLEGDVASAAREYLLENFLPDYAAYDVIIGYRADDSYFSFARTFLSGALSYANLSRAICLGNLGLQVVLKSRKAFDAIEFESATRAVRGEYLHEKENRDSQARHEFQQLKSTPFNPGELYMINILQERLKSDDPRLR